MALFFSFLAWWKQNKKRWGWRREERQSELLNGGTQSEYLICWFYWIKGEKVVLVCCLPVKPWQASILFPDWSFLLQYRIQSVIMAYIWAVLHTQLKFSGWTIYLWPGELVTQFPWRSFVAVSLVASPFLKMDCPAAAPASKPRAWRFTWTSQTPLFILWEEGVWLKQFQGPKCFRTLVVFSELSWEGLFYFRYYHLMTSDLESFQKITS